jgi:DNA-binding response OmpR family regulator
MARVLVAEDEKSLAELVRLNLEDDGHEVQIVEDGRYALRAMMKDGPFDVVITDLMMPWCDGFDFLRAMGAKHGGARVIVLTAKDDGYTRARAGAENVDVFLTKPYDPAVLSQKVAQLARMKAGANYAAEG